MTLIEKGYLGAKSASGAYQAIINLMPPHDTYIEPFLGTGAIMKKKAPATRNIGMDLNQHCIDEFNYAAAKVELYVGCAFEYLKNFDYQNNGRVMVYLDPPYHPDTRTSSAKYEHELTEDQHRDLLKICLKLPCLVIISGYMNDLYKELLTDWWSHSFQVMSHGGVRTETVWCNFEPGDIHFHTFAGKNYTDRQRIQRKANRWAKSYGKLPPGERQAIMAALLQVGAEISTEKA